MKFSVHLLEIRQALYAPTYQKPNFCSENSVSMCSQPLYSRGS